MLNCPGLFAAKRKEMEKAYAHLQCRMEVYEDASPEQLHREIEEMQTDCLEYDVLLNKVIQGSRTPLISQLAQAQLNYNQTAEAIVASAIQTHNTPDAQAEATAVFAEFAMDQAIHSMNNALLAAMIAMEKQHALNDHHREDAK